MRKLLLLLLLVAALILPVSAQEYTAPEIQGEAAQRMPESTGVLSKDLWMVFRNAVGELSPDVREAAGVCLRIFAAVLVMSMLRAFDGPAKRTVELGGTVLVGVSLLSATGSMIHLAADTVQEIGEYGKLLLPVMTAAMAAQGGVTASAALYAGTVFFQTVLTNLIASALIPLVYVSLSLSLASCAMENEPLKKLQDFIKWLIGWSLRTILYLFTGYMGITGVVSGSTDAAALKVTKLTISGMVPVVGGILSDASEAVLVGAGVMKNAAGIYGVAAILTVWLLPFLRIGVHYLLLRMTAAICGIFDTKSTARLVQDFSASMGSLLGMTAAVCVMMLLSTVCFLRGVS